MIDTTKMHKENHCGEPDKDAGAVAAELEFVCETHLCLTCFGVDQIPKILQKNFGLEETNLCVPC